MKEWFINTLKRLSYCYVNGFLIISLVLLVITYFFRPANYGENRYVRGFVSDIVPYVESLSGSRYGKLDGYEIFIVGIEKPFYSFGYDEINNYGIPNIVNKQVTICYYNLYNSNERENYTYVQSLRIGNQIIYGQKDLLGIKGYWMVLGLTIFSCFMLVWGVWQRLKEDFSG